MDYSRLIKHFRPSSSSPAAHSSQQPTPTVSRNFPPLLHDVASKRAVDGACDQNDDGDPKFDFRKVAENGVVDGAAAKFTLKGALQNTVASSSNDHTPATKTSSPEPISARPATVITAFNKLSPAELRDLSHPSVPHLKLATINHPSGGTPQLIYHSYPLPLLLAISPRIATVLSSHPTYDTANNPPTGLLLHTPFPSALSLLLSFALLSSQHGSASAPAARDLLSIPLKKCAFYKYGRIVEEARYLGWVYVEEMLARRMRGIAAGQVHSRDVERILVREGARCANGAARMVSKIDDGNMSECVNSSPDSSTEKGSSTSWMLALSIQSVAKALLQDRLQYREKYEDLCERYPDFGLELEEAVAELRRGQLPH